MYLIDSSMQKLGIINSVGFFFFFIVFNHPYITTKKKKKNVIKIIIKKKLLATIQKFYTMEKSNI